MTCRVLFLHYWSLAVEEQFYVAVPFLMTGAAILFRKNVRTAVLSLLVLVAVVSLAASLIVIEQSQPHAFFYPQYRAWQLAIGGLSGVLLEQRDRIPTAIHSSAAMLGVAAVVVCIVVFDERISWPGPLALALTLGTSALILGLNAGRLSSSLSRVLSFSPIVRIGDMSLQPLSLALAGSRFPRRPLARARRHNHFRRSHHHGPFLASAARLALCRPQGADHRGDKLWRPES